MSFCFSSLNGSLWLCHHIFMTSKCVHREEMFSAFLSLKGKYCMLKNLYSRQFQGMKSMRHLLEYWYVTPPPYIRLRTDTSWRSPRIKNSLWPTVSDQTWRDDPWEDGHLVLWKGAGGGDGNKMAWLYSAIFPFLSVIPLSLDKHSRTPEIFTTSWSLLRNERPELKDCTGPDRAKL